MPYKEWAFFLERYLRGKSAVVFVGGLLEQ